MSKISKSLSELAIALGGVLSDPSQANISVSGLSLSSRHLKGGDLFIAQRGVKVDGHDFIDAAFTAGAVAVLASDAAALNGRPGIVVPDVRRAASRLASFWNGFPSEKMEIIGVTGTNGKTTTNWILFHALKALRGGCIRIGTLGYSIEDSEQGVLAQEDGELTTPDALSIHEKLAAAAARSVGAAVLETSSHALDQCRVDDVAFDVAVFTNLTRDHLDYHSDMESYFCAKLKLFELSAKNKKKTKASVVNIDSEFGAELLTRTADSGLRTLSYGYDDRAMIRINRFEQALSESLLELRYAGAKYEIKSGLIGTHNSYNLAAAMGALVALGFGAQDSVKVLSQVPQVPGRLQSVFAPGFGVYVDYAHSPDALENVLKTVREITQKKVWVVFGCGGDRDKGKRPQMGEIARRLADKVVITSDNPRTEDPKAILRDILSTGVKADMVEVDRKEAIRKALESASNGDVVLIAGKGHEDYQVIGTEKQHFSDVEEAKKVIANLG